MAVSMDVLNQISLILRNDRGQTTRLRSLLIELGSLPSYRTWLEQGQFNGRRFRLPRDFISPKTKERRLLEAMRLVTDDLLQVKVNLVEDQLIFLTDGLFVPGDFRVFPWHDESDHLIEACGQIGWDGWGTVLIDPAIGAGHNALRFEVENRLGFDVNIRALCYSTINSLLNERPLSLVAINDIVNGIPMTLIDAPANVLLPMNLPFVMEPVPGGIVRSAAGGVEGDEKTVAALLAVREFDRRAARDTKIRALVLAYSVGNREKGTWTIEQKARNIFPDATLMWRVLENERLWRINGKKEQPNPMPLSSLKLKADCRYYVRDERLREPLRVGYIEKERELRHRGFDSLAYGVLTIDLG